MQKKRRDEKRGEADRMQERAKRELKSIPRKYKEATTLKEGGRGQSQKKRR